MDYGYVILLLLGFGLIGAGVKYVDASFDDDAFDRRKAYVVALASGALMGGFIGVDAYAATVLVAIIIGVAITKKIDAPAFIAGAIVALAVPAAFSNQIVVYALPVAVLSLSAVIDELGNDLVDERRIRNGAATLFFGNRLTMEVFVAALVFAGVFPFVYLLALLAFDSGYHLLTYYVDSLKRERRRHAR